MLTALTRAVSPTIGSCELTWVPREKIDIERAIDQHHEYEWALAGLGLSVISLPAEPEFPDATFVEDPLVVVDEVAIATRMGALSRRGEAESLASAISAYRPVRRLCEPATLEGGDVMRIGREVFVGLTQRTNEAGIDQLRTELQPLGYGIHQVAVHGCLHLKSACCPLGEGEILANPAWVDLSPFRKYKIVGVAEDEPGAANVLRIEDTILMPACFPHTENILKRQGYQIRTVDISELIKAEAAITCSSVIFETRDDV